MKKIIVISAAVFVWSQLAFSSSPCENITHSYNLGSTTRTAVKALNSDVSNVVAGSAKSIAECRMVGTPDVTACLSIAQSTYQNGIFLVFDIFGLPDGEWSDGVFISKNDSGSDLVFSGNSLQASRSSWSHGNSKGHTYGGTKTLIKYDKFLGQLTYESYEGSPGVLPFLKSWKIKQRNTFTCNSL